MVADTQPFQSAIQQDDELLSWDHVRTFLALYRAGTYNGAAEFLGVDHSTARRKIQALESAIGGHIFRRHDGRLLLAAGRDALLEVALEMERSAALFAQQLRVSEHAGTVRVSMLDVFSSLLAADVGKFSEQNTGICLDITTEPYFVDLDRELVDIALRLAKPVHESGGSRKVATVAFSVYGSKEYLERVLPGEVHDVIGLSASFAHNDHDFFLADTQWYASAGIDCRIVARVDNYPLMTAMCEDGMGLALLPKFVAETKPRLCRSSGINISVSIDAWLLVRKDAAKIPKVRIAVDYLIDSMARRAAQLST